MAAADAMPMLGPTPGSGELVPVGSAGRKLWSQRASRITMSIDETLSGATASGIQPLALMDAKASGQPSGAVELQQDSTLVTLQPPPASASIAEPFRPRGDALASSSSASLSERLDVVLQEMKVKQMEQALAAKQESNALRKEVFDAFQAERAGRRQEVAELRAMVNAVCERLSGELQDVDARVRALGGFPSVDGSLKGGMFVEGMMRSEEVDKRLQEVEERAERQRREWQDMILQELSGVQAAYEAKLLQMMQAQGRGGAQIDSCLASSSGSPSRFSVPEQIKIVQAELESKVQDDMATFSEAVEALAKELVDERQRVSQLAEAVAFETQTRQEETARFEQALKRQAREDIEARLAVAGSGSAELGTKTESLEQSLVTLERSVIEQIKLQMETLQGESTQRVHDVAGLRDALAAVSAREEVIRTDLDVKLEDVRNLVSTSANSEILQLRSEMSNARKEFTQIQAGMQEVRESENKERAILYDCMLKELEAVEVRLTEALAPKSTTEMQVQNLRNHLAAAVEAAELKIMEHVQAAVVAEQESRLAAIQFVSNSFIELSQATQVERSSNLEAMEAFGTAVNSQLEAHTDSNAKLQQELEQRVENAVRSVHELADTAVTPVQIATEASLRAMQETCGVLQGTVGTLQTQVHTDRQAILTATTQVQELAMEMKADKEARRASLASLREEIAQHLLRAGEMVAGDVADLQQRVANSSGVQALIDESLQKFKAQLHQPEEDTFRMQALIDSSLEELKSQLRHTMQAGDIGLVQAGTDELHDPQTASWLRRLESESQSDRVKLNQLYAWFESVRDGVSPRHLPRGAAAEEQQVAAMPWSPAEHSETLSDLSAGIANELSDLRVWAEGRFAHVCQSQLEFKAEVEAVLCERSKPSSEKTTSPSPPRKCASPKKSGSAAHFPPPSAELLVDSCTEGSSDGTPRRVVRHKPTQRTKRPSTVAEHPCDTDSKADTSDYGGSAAAAQAAVLSPKSTGRAEEEQRLDRMLDGFSSMERLERFEQELAAMRNLVQTQERSMSALQQVVQEAEERRKSMPHPVVVLPERRPSQPTRREPVSVLSRASSPVPLATIAAGVAAATTGHVVTRGGPFVAAPAQGPLLLPGVQSVTSVANARRAA